MSSSLPVPRPGYHSVTPTLTLKNCAAAIDFYKAAFNAVELYRLAMPNGSVMHAEIKIGDSTLMVSDEFPDWGCLSPLSTGGFPSALMIYVENVDAVFAQALAAGATELRPVTDQFWGDRSGQVQDPYGYKWSVSTPMEDVSPEELARRAASFCS